MLVFELSVSFDIILFQLQLKSAFDEAKNNGLIMFFVPHSKDALFKSLTFWNAWNWSSFLNTVSFITKLADGVSRQDPVFNSV